MAQYKNFDSIELPKSVIKQNNSADECPICGGSGVVFDNAGNMKPCHCWKQKQQRKKMQKAQLPSALQKMTFTNFDMSFYPANEIPDFAYEYKFSYLDYAKNARKKAVNFVQEILGGEDLSQVAGLMFQGQVGSGKTHLSAAIANNLISNGIDVLFLVVPDFLDEMRMSYGNLGEFDETAMMDNAKKAQVLILDDLGMHNFSEWTKNKLFTLINYRLNNQLPMIITTNMKMEDLKELVGERITSRIIAACEPCMLPVKIDIRLAKLHK